MDNDSGQKTVLHNAITYNLKNGKPLQLKELFVDGFNDSLTEAVNLKFKQFGIPQIDKFDAIDKQQNFYMENDALVLIYNKGEASNFADGEVYIPFLFTDLIGILK
jgi:putative anti-sigV factor